MDNVNSKGNVEYEQKEKEVNSKDEKQLTSHVIVQTSDIPFSCDICDKIFSQKSHLTRHKKTHTIEKPHACGTCGKAFAIKQMLISHIMIHIDEKPFICELCGVALHTRQFSCEECEQLFFTKKDSSSHKKLMQMTTQIVVMFVERLSLIIGIWLDTR